MPQKRNYAELSTSRLYRLAEQIVGRDLPKIIIVIRQLEDVQARFKERESPYKPRLRVVWPDD